MMKKIFYLAGMLLAMISCKKEPGDTNQSKTTSEYLPLAIGNYWVYEISDKGEELNYPFQTDSLVISGDTILWGSKYFRLDSYTKSRPYKEFIYRGCVYKRDSTKYLVDSYGRTLFSENNFIDTLYRKTEIFDDNIIYTASYKMEKPVTLPSYIDSFKNVLALTGTIIPGQPKGGDPLYTHLYYSKGIGEIAQNYYLLYSREEVVRILVKYKVN